MNQQKQRTKKLNPPTPKKPPKNAHNTNTPKKLISAYTIQPLKAKKHRQF